MTNQPLKYEHILDAVYNQPWAILESSLLTICDVLKFRAEGGHYSDEEIQARIGSPPIRAGAARNGSVAVLPLYGIISQRQSLMSDTSGGTSTEQFSKAFREAMADSSVSAIVLDVDSQGGAVAGIRELWDTMTAHRGQKPVVAVANSLMASAAYWIASAADEIVVSPSADIGSIGVITAHQDVSAAADIQGVKTTIISAGKFKAEANPFEPLSDEARANIQARVDEAYNAFANSVAKGRGVNVSAVRNGFGQGRVVGAKEAVSLGMADREATLDQTIARLLGTAPSRNGARAETFATWGDATYLDTDTYSVTFDGTSTTLPEGVEVFGFYGDSIDDIPDGPASNRDRRRALMG